jgi:hypothetical protein
MKKTRNVALATLICAVGAIQPSFEQATSSLERTPGGPTSCTSMPTNNGHCQKLSVNGELGYYCVDWGTGCFDCFR